MANVWCERHKHFVHIQEVARDVMRECSITRDDMEASLRTKEKKLFLRLQLSILEEQNKRESLLSQDRPFISDRGPDPLIFALQYVSSDEADRLARTPAGQACLERYRSSLVVVLCPLAKPTDDGFRLVPTTCEQKKFTTLLCEFLHRYQIPHIYVNETDHHRRVAVLERAMKGELQILLDLDSECYPLNIPFTLHEKSPQQPDKSLRALHFSTDKVQCCFKTFPSGRSNRMVCRYGKEQFVLVSFDKKVPAHVVIKVLKKGLLINGEEYHFLGCSSSGLRNRTCYLYKGTDNDVRTVFDECGSFSHIKSVSVKLKRIGLLFSEAYPTGITLCDEDIMESDDIEREAFNFTDGCGAISKHLAQRIKSKAKLQLKPDGYLPCVFQIRHQGCKGVVMIDTSLRDNQMMVRKSMKKFEPGKKPFPELWLCDHSRPYSFGHLNKQFIMLLSGLGVKDEVFLSKQMKHFSRLEIMTMDPTAAFETLQWNNQPVLATRVAKFSQEELKADHFLQKELSKLKSKLVEKLEKLHLLVPESRNVFGVCDPLGVLQYGECFFRPTIRGEPRTLSGYVTVAKNPCYLLGDVRRLKAVSDSKRTQQLEQLVDCIVFPTNGKQPHPNEIAGSDLDGDQYFVCWEKDLIIPTVCDPYDYPASASKLPSQMEMIEYFAQQNELSATMGKIDSYFKYWADKEGINCKECEELGRHFAHSVDSAKTGVRVSIPRNLVPPKHTDTDQTVVQKRVWTKMEQAATEEKRKLSQKLVFDSIPGAVTEEFVWSLLQNEELNMSDFQLFKFVKQWCFHQEQFTDDEALEKLREFSDCINFGNFTVEQQTTAMDVGIPREVVTNALNKSQLLTPSMRAHFCLDSPHCGWRFYFRFDSATFEGHHLLRALERYPETMIIFELPNTVTVALHFLIQLEHGTTRLNAGSVVAYFFSPHYALSQRCVLGPEYTIELDSEMLQLYRGEKTATFVKLAFEAKERSSSVTVGETVYDQISVDLTRFKQDILTKLQHPKVRKETFHCIEVFVKSVDHKPAHFDILLADFPDEFVQPMPDDLIEEIPFEEEHEDKEELDLESLQPYSRTEALAVLQNAANKGNAIHFLAILQFIISNEGEWNHSSQLINDLQSFLQTLLTTMVARDGHKSSTPDTTECLETIITTLLCSCFQTPLSKLQLLDRLFRLHHSSLAVQIVQTFHESTVPDYLEAVSGWQWWCFLPQKTSHQILDVIKPPSAVLSVDHQHTSSPECQIAPSACSDTAIAQYTVHFSHLLLYHFIDEIHESQSQAFKDDSKTGGRLKKLKAYDFKDPHPITDDGENRSDCTVPNKPAKFRVGFTAKTGVPLTKFSVGTFVMISPMKMSSVKQIPVIALGRILQVSRQPANLVLEVEETVPYCLRLSARISKGHWQLNLIGNIIAFNRSMKALQKIFSDKLCSTKLLPLLVHPGEGLVDHTSNLDSNSSFTPKNGVTSPQTESRVSSVLQKDSGDVQLQSTHDCVFNESQWKAIEAAFSQQVTLIHGPPGTGKTHVACEIVQRVCRQKYSNNRAKVLVAAETNMAVDNLTRKLLQRNVIVVRVGNVEHMCDDVRHVSLEHQLQIKHLELGKDKKKGHFDGAQEILNAAEVVATTCTGAGDTVLKDLIFPFVVIDEATQATEPVSVVPLVHRCEQLTLIGDPKQLPPTLLNSTDTPHSLSVSLFHRLCENLPTFFLEEQHRMHPAIADFPSNEFYEGKLKSAPSLNNRKSPVDLIWPEKDKPLIFINVKTSKEERFSTSYQNTAEAEMVVKVVVSFLGNNVNQSEIAVLTPYAGQVKCIRQKLGQVAKCVEVHSVDGFQGREKEIVVFSTVRTRMLGFTADKHRINVLLTRAKYGIVGIGSYDALSSDPTWETWLRQVHIEESEKCLRKEHKLRPAQHISKANTSSAQNKVHSREFKLCKFIEQGCRNGKNCRYAHSQDELQEWTRARPLQAKKRRKESGGL